LKFVLYIQIKSIKISRIWAKTRGIHFSSPKGGKMQREKEVEKIIDKICAFIRDVPIEDPDWKIHRNGMIEDLKEFIEILARRNVIGVRPPWCIGDIPKYPPIFKTFEKN